MNRKTNIFYNLHDNDSKFLTFSNYTEYLTGNFLSVNTKLFPSSFLCVNIPSESIDSFKNDLIYFYENKLATLRDESIEKGISVEDQVYPLGYLIDLIVAYGGNDAIKYIGNISEEDYDGTYTDIICIIQQIGNFNKYIVQHQSEETQSSIEIQDYLYGWESYIKDDEHTTINIGNYELDLHSNKKDIELVNDEIKLIDSLYYLNTPYSTNIIINGQNVLSSITFNCVIPLFDVINTDTVHNEIITESSELYIREINKNIPLGIWISEEPIELKKDNQTNYVPSWSLMITSQFKPFPYSKKLLTDTIRNKNLHAFNTFASVLAEQAKITDMISKLSNDIQIMSLQIESLQNKINESSSVSSSFNLIKDQMTKLEYDISTKMENLKTELDEKYEALKWQASV